MSAAILLLRCQKESFHLLVKLEILLAIPRIWYQNTRRRLLFFFAYIPPEPHYPHRQTTSRACELTHNLPWPEIADIWASAPVGQLPSHISLKLPKYPLRTFAFPKCLYLAWRVDATELLAKMCEHVFFFNFKAYSKKCSYQTSKFARFIH